MSMSVSKKKKVYFWLYIIEVHPEAWNLQPTQQPPPTHCVDTTFNKTQP